MTVMMIAKPGKKDIHGCERTRTLPSEIMVPHAGVGGWAPNPRKLNEAPIRITKPISKVVLTMRGDIQFGKISRNAIRKRLVPKARLASINCSSFIDNVSPWTNRVTQGHHANDIANIALVRFGDKAVVTAKAKTNGGTAKKMSAVRMKIIFDLPP